MSNLFKSTLQKIRENKENLQSGKPNCIPFYNYPRLSKVIPGIVQGTNWLVSANSGVGKSQFTKATFILDPLIWLEQHKEEFPESNIDIKINYFALEESKEEFTYSIISNKLKDKFDLTVDPLDLMSMYEKETVSDDLLSKIESLGDYFNYFFSKVNVIDSIGNPTGIYRYIREYTEEVGTHYFYNFMIDKDKTNCITRAEYKKIKDTTLGKQFAYSHYIPSNPDQYVINIVDHIGLLTSESGGSLHDAMTMMSASYGRKQITKHYNHVFVMVQQQAGAQESELYTNTGKKIIDKMKPSLSGLADNKTTQRDCHLVMGLFAPDRYVTEETSNYKGYDIKRFKDQYRSLLILKNRIGRGNLEVPLLFNGAVTSFKELPSIMTSKDYEYLEKVQKSINKI